MGRGRIWEPDVRARVNRQRDWSERMNLCGISRNDDLTGVSWSSVIAGRQVGLTTSREVLSPQFWRQLRKKLGVFVAGRGD